jgi:uncharacterized membrane protein
VSDPAVPARADRLDLLRGVAIVWMAAYHFAFDLNHFGWLQPRQQFNLDALWVVQRSCILGLFLFCAGFAQALALHRGQRWPQFWRRWAQIAGCAVLVSLGSWLVFPNSWIHFGVLHGMGMALMLVAARLAAPLGRGLWAAGAAALVLPRVVQHRMFDSPWLDWTGLVTRKPVTEDYVPLLPWLGLMFWGLAAGQWVLARRPWWLQGVVRTGPQRALVVLGRWSLTFYMLHQPLFFGLLMAVAALRTVR